MALKRETQCLHTGNEVDVQTGASSVPIYQASTFHQQGFDDNPQFDYARSGNPTRQALEDIIAALEGGTRGFAFASGMAAITATLLLLSTGDHVVACEDIYGGSFRALTRVFSRLGIETTFVDTTDVLAVESAICTNTRAMLLETPSNPTLKITDLRACLALARDRGILSIVDNTFMSPYLQRPHDLGADIVVHSATKFLGGHSDVVAGLATVANDVIGDELYLIQNGFGAVLGPHDSWLVMRGIKTLAIRMRQSQDTAMQLANFFVNHPKVGKVYYPGLLQHPGSTVHAAQTDGPGAVLSLELADAQAVDKLVHQLRLPLFAVSLGAVESILSYPRTMSHAAMPTAEREKRGITDGLLRLSVGLEDVADLLEDFETALRFV